MAKQNKKTRAGFEDMTAFSGVPTEAIKEAFERASTFSGDFGDVTRANVEAMTQSLQVAGKGITEMNTKAFGFMQANLQRNMEAARTLGAIKSADDMSVLQDMTKAGFSAYVEQMNEMSSLFTTTLRAAVEPLNAQAGAVAQKFQAST